MHNNAKQQVVKSSITWFCSYAYVTENEYLPSTVLWTYVILTFKLTSEMHDIFWAWQHSVKKSEQQPQYTPWSLWHMHHAGPIAKNDLPR